MKGNTIETSVPIPQGCQASIHGTTLKTQGPKGTVERRVLTPGISAKVEGDSIKMSTQNATKNQKRALFTAAAHIKNMLRGSKEGFSYTLKICSGHFPMTVKATKDEFSIKNFLGEKVPRTMKVRPGVDIKVEGQTIKVSSPDIELAGMTAAAIEHITFISKRDRRIFQDGIYIIEKPQREN